MISKIKTLAISDDFKSKKKSIKITESDINRLNSKIKAELEQNANARLKGLVATHQINKLSDIDDEDEREI